MDGTLTFSDIQNEYSAMEFVPRKTPISDIYNVSFTIPILISVTRYKL